MELASSIAALCVYRGAGLVAWSCFALAPDIQGEREARAQIESVGAGLVPARLKSPHAGQGQALPLQIFLPYSDLYYSTSLLIPLLFCRSADRAFRVHAHLLLSQVL